MTELNAHQVTRHVSLNLIYCRMRFLLDGVEWSVSGICLILAYSNYHYCRVKPVACEHSRYQVLLGCLLLT